MKSGCDVVCSSLVSPRPLFVHPPAFPAAQSFSAGRWHTGHLALRWRPSSSSTEARLSSALVVLIRQPQVLSSSMAPIDIITHHHVCTCAFKEVDFSLGVREAEMEKVNQHKNNILIQTGSTRNVPVCTW